MRVGDKGCDRFGTAGCADNASDVGEKGSAILHARGGGIAHSFESLRVIS